MIEMILVTHDGIGVVRDRFDKNPLRPLSKRESLNQEQKRSAL
jgi:hypothetical protein